MLLPNIWNSNPRQQRTQTLADSYGSTNGRDIIIVNNEDSVFHHMPSSPSIPATNAIVEYQRKPVEAPDDPTWDIDSDASAGDYTSSDTDAFGKYMKLETETNIFGYAWIQNSDADIIFDKSKSWCLNMMVKFLIATDGVGDNNYGYEAYAGLMANISASPFLSGDDARDFYIVFHKAEDSQYLTSHIWGTSGSVEFGVNPNVYGPTFHLWDSTHFEQWLELGIRYSSKDKAIYFHFGGLLEAGNQAAAKLTDAQLNILDGASLYITFGISNSDVYAQEFDINNYTLIKNY